MAKRQSFADKASKVSHAANCKICNSAVTPTLFLLANKTDKGTYKYKKNMINICKCNHKKYYG